MRAVAKIHTSGACISLFVCLLGSVPRSTNKMATENSNSLPFLLFSDLDNGEISTDFTMHFMAMPVCSPVFRLVSRTVCPFFGSCSSLSGLSFLSRSPGACFCRFFVCVCAALLCAVLFFVGHFFAGCSAATASFSTLNGVLPTFSKNHFI